VSDDHPQPGAGADDPFADGLQAYPEYPSSYGMQESAPPPPAQPKSIQTAVKLMRAGAALTAVSLVIALLTYGSLKSHLRDQLRDSNKTYTAHDFDVLYRIALIEVIFASLLGIGLWLWMAWKNGQGRSWARTVATVLGVINLLYSLYAVVSGSTIAVSLVLTLLNLVLAVTILGFLWQSQSSEFYAATTRHRSQFGG
jgi:hypothetical protein